MKYIKKYQKYLILLNMITSALILYNGNIIIMRIGCILITILNTYFIIIIQDRIINSHLIIFISSMRTINKSISESHKKIDKANHKLEVVLSKLKPGA